MPRVKCPRCRNKGETGSMFGPRDSKGPEILVFPGNIPGTTKSLLRCRSCGTAFTKAPIGRGKPVTQEQWDHMEEQVAANLPDHMVTYSDFDDDEG